MFFKINSLPQHDHRLWLWGSNTISHHFKQVYVSVAFFDKIQILLTHFLWLWTCSAGWCGCTCQSASGCIPCWDYSVKADCCASSFLACLWLPCSTCWGKSSTAVSGVSHLLSLDRRTQNWPLVKNIGGRPFNCIKHLCNISHMLFTLFISRETKGELND